MELKGETSKMQQLIMEFNNLNLRAFAIEHGNGDSFNEHLSFKRNTGELLNTKELITEVKHLHLLCNRISKEIMKTITLEGIDQFVQEENKDFFVRINYVDDPDSLDKLLFPLDCLHIKKKKFDQYKKKWSFTCETCAKRLSSTTDKEYYTLYPTYPIDSEEERKNHRACSKQCIKVIAKDIVFDWVKGKDYQKYFDFSSIDKKLDDFMQKI